MQIAGSDTVDKAARHDLDGLSPSPTIEARTARRHQFAGLAAMANRTVPGLTTSEAALAAMTAADPDSLFALTEQGRLVGGIAFLFLNEEGHDALLLDAITLTAPERRFIATRGEPVAAIYVWALAARGKGVTGFANVAMALRTPRYREADYFAQPSSLTGRRLLQALGFRPFPSFQPDLWHYARWRRGPAASLRYSTTEAYTHDAA